MTRTHGVNYEPFSRLRTEHFAALTMKVRSESSQRNDPGPWGGTGGILVLTDVGHPVPWGS
jgi:hypothetical protein